MEQTIFQLNNYLAYAIQALEDVRFSISPTKFLQLLEATFSKKPADFVGKHAGSWNVIGEVLLAKFLVPGSKEINKFVVAVKTYQLIRAFAAEEPFTTEKTAVEDYFKRPLEIPGIVKFLQENYSPSNHALGIPEPQEGPSLPSMTFEEEVKVYQKEIEAVKAAMVELDVKRAEDSTLVLDRIETNPRDKGQTLLVHSLAKKNSLSTATKSLTDKLGIEVGKASLNTVQEALEEELVKVAKKAPKAPEKNISFRINGNLVRATRRTGSQWEVSQEMKDARTEQLASRQQELGKLAVRPLGIGELRVVQEEDIRYEAGEIAHIENVLKGETKNRTHVRENTVETTYSTYKESVSETERELETSDRYELQTESRNAQSSDNYFDLGVNVSASYGAWLDVSVDTKYGNKSSREHSDSQAETYTKDVLEKARTKISQTVRETKTSTVVSKVSETNFHQLTAENGNTVGIYRWVNKVYTARLYNKGYRMMYELIVPEPAAWHIYSTLAKAGEDLTIYGIDPPTAPYASLSGSESIPLSPEHLGLENYLYYIQKYQAKGAVSPPAGNVMVPFTLAQSNLDTYRNGLTSEDVDNEKKIKRLFTAGKEIQIPQGYYAHQVSGTVTNSNLWSSWVMEVIREDDESAQNIPNQGTSREQQRQEAAFRILQINVTMADQFKLAIGADSIPLENVAPGENNYPELRWTFHQVLSSSKDGKYEGNLPLTILVDGVVMGFTLGLVVLCKPTPAAMKEWQLDTYQKIMAGYKRMVEDKQEENNGKERLNGIQIMGANPLEGERIVKQELQKHCISMIRQKPVDFLSAIREEDSWFGGAPEINYSIAQDNAKEIQFLEQAFEWSNLLYRMYPYFYGRRENWIDRLASSSADPKFAEFLRAGAARVVLAVRPGYEELVAHFVRTGEIKDFEAGLKIGGDQYLDIIDELRELESTESGKPVGEYEVRIPTNLVVLDDDDAITRLGNMFGPGQNVGG
ncbi:MAG: hypothetical protein H6581_24955 [Bacteroidia bacterium]|nr:hypothetical protein [Bacteroidia bacterium]